MYLNKMEDYESIEDYLQRNSSSGHLYRAIKLYYITRSFYDCLTVSALNNAKPKQANMDTHWDSPLSPQWLCRRSQILTERGSGSARWRSFPSAGGAHISILSSRWRRVLAAMWLSTWQNEDEIQRSMNLLMPMTFSQDMEFFISFVFPLFS